MRLTLKQKWIVTLAVAIALLASPCLSVSTFVGAGKATALAATTSEQAHSHHVDGGSNHAHSDHRHDGGSEPDEAACCKICDAWLSGRQDDTQKAVRTGNTFEPSVKFIDVFALAPQRSDDRRRLIRLSPPSTGVPDSGHGPLYLITGRFRI
ncbi:MAG: hypothetical protein AB7U38_06155 [Hyphomicrobiales bacterium]